MHNNILLFLSLSHTHSDKHSHIFTHTHTFSSPLSLYLSLSISLVLSDALFPFSSHRRKKAAPETRIHGRRAGSVPRVLWRSLAEDEHEG